MHKRNAVTHALLNSTQDTHLLLIQEPWFDTIGTARKDTSQQGVDVLGGVASSTWEILYPGLTEGQRPKVMAYARKWAHNNKSPPFTIVPCLNIANHLCLQVLDLVFDKELWRIFNFYHNIRNDMGLKALLSTDKDAITSTLVVGDFNTHSPSWSPPGIP